MKGTKEPLDKGERGEWKSWLKTQHSKNEDHGIFSHPFSDRFYLLGLQITMDGDYSLEIRRHLLHGGKAMTNLDSILKKRHNFASKNPYSQSYGFSSSQVQVWQFNHEEGWALKNGCFPVVVLENTLESPLDCKEIRPVNLKGNQPCIFIGRFDAEVEVPILWSPDA